MSNAVDLFRKKTDKLFNRIDDYTANEVEKMVEEYVKNKVTKYNLDICIEEVVLSGSRSRGLEHTDSDLDVVVSFLGKEREDVLFDIFNEDEFKIGGIKVDINPIVEWKTGTLEEYLVRVENYLI